MSYTGANEPAPGVNTPAGFAFFKAMFDHIFAQHNADDAILAAATQFNTPGTLVLRDPTSGNVNVGFMNVAAHAAADNLLSLTGFGLQSGYYIRAVEGSTVRFLVDSSGNVMGNNFTAATVSSANPVTAGGTQLAKIDGTNATGDWPISITGTAATATSATTATTAAALATPQPFATTISDYRATPGAAGQITIAAGGPYVDANEQYVPGQLAQTLYLPSQPAGTGVQYVGISLQPTTGAAIYTAAAVGAAASTITFPATNKPNALIVWRGVTTNPSGVVAATDIFDLRVSGGGGGGGGGGGTSGVAASTAMITNGDLSATYPNTISLMTALGGAASLAGGINDPLRLTRRKNGSASLDDLLGYTANGPYYGSLAAAGAQITMNCTAQGNLNGTAPNAITIDGGATLGTRTASTVTNPGGSSTLTSQVGSGGNGGVASATGAGSYTVFADFGVTGPGFALTLGVPGTTSLTNCVKIGYALFDGTAFHTDTILYTGQSVLSGQTIRPHTVKTPLCATTAFTANTIWQPANGATIASLFNTVPVKGEITVTGDFVTGAAAILFDIGLYIDGTLSGYQYHGLSQPGTTVASLSVTIPFEAGEVLGVNSGGHSFQPAVRQSNSTNTNSYQNLYLRGEFWAV